MGRVLVLGGTTEASALARLLADRGVGAVFSYAGRTETPTPQPMPTRTGGFGGVEGLANYLRTEAIAAVVDATHPFAAGISRNALAASAATGVPLIALERPGWKEVPGDRWTRVPGTTAAVAALPDTPSRIFLAIGRQALEPFAAKPWHHYLLRLVDPPDGPLPLPDTTVILARGPFDPDGDRALLQTHRITQIVAKNSGGTGAEAKLTAARALGLPVILIDRPTLTDREVLTSPEEVLAWLHARLGV